MAGEWIKMRTNLWDDPRISKLCDITDQPEAAIVGGLYWLWATADEHTESGILPGLTTRAIDRKTGVTGLGQGLVAIGWLADHPEGVLIVGFDEHNGASAKRRCSEAKRKGETRKASASGADNNPTDAGLSAELEKIREEESKALAIAALIASEEERKKAEAKAIADAARKAKRAEADSRVPCEAIFTAYSTNLPELPQIKIKDEARRSAIRSLWRSDERFQSVDFWDRYFQSVRSSTFLMGMNAIGFDWLMKPANFKKVAEGNYQ
jgi:hypothetical protein